MERETEGDSRVPFSSIIPNFGRGEEGEGREDDLAFFTFGDWVEGVEEGVFDWGSGGEFWSFLFRGISTILLYISAYVNDVM